MAIRYNGQEVKKVIYNNQRVDKVYYNGQRIDIDNNYRYEDDESRIGQSELSYTLENGIVKVNLYTGRMLFQQNELEIGAGNFKIRVFHIYNSHLINQEVSNHINGKRWRLNIEQRCYKIEENTLSYKKGDYIYVDESGYNHRFIKYKEGEEESYYDDSGSNLKLIVSENEVKIEEDSGNKYLFDNQGRLKNIISGLNENINKVIEYLDNGNIQIYDKRKASRKIQLIYSNFLLSKIEVIEEGVVKKGYSYTYNSSNQLILINKRSSQTSLPEAVTSFEYDENENLTKIIEQKDRKSIFISYSKMGINKYQVVSVTTGISHINATNGNQEIAESNCLSRSEYKYIEDNKTEVINEKEIVQLYCFNKRGFTSSLFEKDTEGNYHTFTKESGWDLYVEGNESEKINNKKITKLKRNIYVVNNEKLENFKSIFKDNENGTDSSNLYNEEFVVSGYLRLNQGIGKQLKLRAVFNIETIGLVIVDGISVPSTVINKVYGEVILDNTAINVFQKISIPIDLQQFSYIESAKTYKNNIKSMYLDIIGVDEEIDVDIADLKISNGANVKILIDNKDTTYLEKFYYVDKNGRQERTIQKDYFMSTNDIINTYKSLYKERIINQKEYFDLYLCSGCKKVSVKEVGYIRSEDIPFAFKDGKANLTLVSKTRFNDSRYLSTSTVMLFNPSYFEEETKVDITGTFSLSELFTDDSTRIIKRYLHQGLLLSEQDGYGVIHRIEYDSFFNVIRELIYNKDDTENKITKEYTYDSNDPSLKEVIENQKEAEIGQRITYTTPFLNIATHQVLGGTPGEYQSIFTYDAYQEKILSIQANNGATLLKQDYTYDAKGYLKEIRDSNNHHYKVLRDNFGNIVSYIQIDQNNNEQEILTKNYLLNNGNNHQDIVTETFYNNDELTSRSIILNRYGQVLQIQEEEKVTTYTYQEIDESPLLKKVLGIYDPYTKQMYHYNYNIDNNVYGYDLTTSTETLNKSLSIRQIEANKTQYIFKDGDEQKVRTSEVIYENEEVVAGSKKIYIAPRVRRVIDKIDELEDEFNYEYFYDLLGRVSRIKNVYSDERIISHVEDLQYNELNLISSSRSQFIKAGYDEGENLVTAFFLLDNYIYDDRGNLIRINRIEEEYVDSSTVPSYTLTNQITYTYDSMNRIVNETNNKTNLNIIYTYLNGKLSSISRNNNLEEFTYNEKRQLALKNSNTYYQTFTYDKYGNMSQVGVALDGYPIVYTTLEYERGNLLSKYGTYNYFNNYQGRRYKKIVNGVTTYFYLDGNKILGEDRSDGKKLRYYYNMNGIAGFTYLGLVFKYVIDVLGNVTKIMHDEDLICEYDYDALGNVTVIRKEKKITINNEEIDISIVGEINPFRFKGYYYDVETKMYYINGRYYDPSIGICINASNIDEIIDNAFVINGLDRQAITIDNILSNSPYEACILTYEQYYPDSTYYESEGKSWWEINWVKVVKTIIAITFLVVAIVLTAIPVTHCIGLTMLSLGAKASVSGFLWGGVVGGLIASIQGSNVLEGSINGALEGLIDGFIDGAILGLISGAAHISGNCFKKGTLVLTEDGHKKIEDIKVGDKVYAYSEKTNEKSLKRVVRLFRNKTKKWINLYIYNKNNKKVEKIDCTPGHKFYLPLFKKWVSANELVRGTLLLLEDGSYSIVLKNIIEELETEEETYNFEVEDYHTYYVGNQGVLVHNRNCRNSYGKKGGVAHQKKVAEMEDVLNKKYGPTKVEKEVYVQTPDGAKRGRFIDVAAVEGKEIVEGYQIGRVSKVKRKIVSREQIALDDIEKALKRQVVKFIPYN